MRANSELKIHILDVGHGDATIVEFPDLGARARFAAIDFGAKLGVDRAVAADYMDSLVELRAEGDLFFEYDIEFVCVTHPHNDHYGGLRRFMDRFSSPPATDRVRQLWDCGFRTTSSQYNQVLQRVLQNPSLDFVRVSSGTEFEFGDVRVQVLAPSIDLRNRFDTYGVGKNDSSIVLRLKFGNSIAILAADAEFASWGKITEEFPRREAIDFFDDALGMAERNDTSDQLKCDLLKVAHHGSKHGSSLEYLERLRPNRIVYTAGSPAWYAANIPDWAGRFPHPLTESILSELDAGLDVRTTGDVGSVIFKYDGGWTPRDVAEISQTPGDAGFEAALLTAWLA